MKKSIILQNKKITYTLRKSNRARALMLSVHPDGSVVMTLPHRLGENIAERFIKEKADWIFSKLKLFKKLEGGLVIENKKRNYALHKERALNLVKSKADYFSEIHGFEFKKISVKNQKSRWGSCSKQGNINFNYKIVFLPERLADYIVVHELCHTKELNHSKNFWKLVAEILPDYQQLRKEIKRIR